MVAAQPASWVVSRAAGIDGLAVVNVVWWSVLRKGLVRASSGSSIVSGSETEEEKEVGWPLYLRRAKAPL